MKYIILIIISFINLYSYFVSPLLGARCRFQPTCSSYAKEALNKHGIFFGLFLSIKRIIKCHPFSSSKYDPVPSKEIDKLNSK